VKLTWYGVTAPDKVVAAEKNVAAQILPKL